MHNYINFWLHIFTILLMNTWKIEVVWKLWRKQWLEKFQTFKNSDIKNFGRYYIRTFQTSENKNVRNFLHLMYSNMPSILFESILFSKSLVCWALHQAQVHALNSPYVLEIIARVREKTRYKLQCNILIGSLTFE